MSAHTANAMAEAVDLRRRVSELPSTSSHANAGSTNDNAVIRVRHAIAVVIPATAAFLIDRSRRHRTSAHAEKVTVAMKTSSRHPSTDQEMRSYSTATIAAIAIPAARDNITVPRR